MHLIQDFLQKQNKNFCIRCFPFPFLTFLGVAGILLHCDSIAYFFVTTYFTTSKIFGFEPIELISFEFKRNLSPGQCLVLNQKIR